MSSARLARGALWLCALGAVLCVLGLVGHVLNIALLDGIVPGRPRMQPSTAVFGLLAVAGVTLRCGPKVSRARRVGSMAIGFVVLLFGVMVVVEYLAGVNLGIDWSHANTPSSAPAPGRPSPLTATALATLGAALLLWDVKLARSAAPSEWLFLSTIFVAFVSIVGHGFGASALYRLAGSHVIGVALPTGVALTATAIAGLLAYPRRSFTAIVTSRGPGGVLLRRLGLAAALAGPLLGALLLALVHATGLVDLPLILALGTVTAVSFALALVVITARPLELAHELSDASRVRVEELLEQAPEGIFIADLTGCYTEVNAAGCRLLGFSRAELVGKTIVDLLPPEDIERLWRSRASLLEGSVEVAEWKLRRKDGTWVPVEVTSKILPDGRWQGFVRDISEQLEFQRKLRASLAEQELLSRVGVELASCLEYNETLSRVLHLVVDFLGDIATIDVVKDGLLQRARVLHRSPAGTQLAQAVAEVGAARAEGHPLWQVLETRQPLLLTHISDEDRTRLGTTPEHARVLDAVRATSAMVVPLIARGQLVAVLSVAACDGSRSYGPADLRLAEEVARRAALALDNVQLYQQSRLQGALTVNLAEGVVLVRAADATIVYANPRFEAMFGYEPRELLGKPMHLLNANTQIGPDEHAQRIIEELNRTGGWHGELENARKDGSRLWCAASISAFDHQEYGKVWISVHSDITERKRLEEKNARSLRDKEILLKEIHHRVKNNLQIISSLFSLQRDRTDSEELKGLLDESRTRVQSIALVHEHVYRSAELAGIDLDGYLRSLSQAIGSSYGAKRVTIEASAEGVVLDVEQAVPCALIVCELVSNCLKHAFADGAGKVWVRARGDEQGWCVLEVADDGRGIPADLDWKEARSLGLRLVRALTHQLRGTLVLDPSDGTCFRIRFAQRQVAVVPASPELSAS